MRIVPYYVGDLQKDPNLENYPFRACRGQGFRLAIPKGPKNLYGRYFATHADFKIIGEWPARSPGRLANKSSGFEWG